MINQLLPLHSPSTPKCLKFLLLLGFLNRSLHCIFLLSSLGSVSWQKTNMPKIEREQWIEQLKYHCIMCLKLLNVLQRNKFLLINFIALKRQNLSFLSSLNSCKIHKMNLNALIILLISGVSLLILPWLKEAFFIPVPPPTKFHY